MKRLFSVLLCAVMLCVFTGCSMVWFPFMPSSELPEVDPAESFTISNEDGEVLLTQDDLEKAEAVWQNTGNGDEAIPVVVLTFNEDGVKKFADATTKYHGQELAILLDGEELLRPTVNEPIVDGTVIISNGDLDTYEKAAELAARINSTKEY